MWSINDSMKSLILLLSLLFACASQERLKITSRWMGRSLAELEAHPFFAKRSFKESQGRRIYEEPPKWRSKASCQALGGCLGLSDGYCQNIFQIEEGKIKKFEMKGACSQDKSKAPLTSN